MLSGTRLTAAIVLLALPALCAALDVDALVASLARPAPATTPFVEVRFSKLLARPIVARGELEYRGPTELSRTVASPFRERTVISGDTVRIEREGQRPRQILLSRVPELRELFGTFAAVLGGDRSALEQSFSLELNGELEGWKLQLIPKDARVRRYVQEIVIDGAGSEPHCLSVHAPNEGASIMLIGEAAGRALPENPQRSWLENHCATPGR